MAKTVKKAVRKAAPRKGAAKRATKTGRGKFVYFFGGGKAEGNRHMKDTLGGKGSGLAEMTNAGLPVPPGFTISTAACNLYYELGGKVPPAVDAEIATHVKRLEKAAGAGAILIGADPMMRTLIEEIKARVEQRGAAQQPVSLVLVVFLSGLLATLVIGCSYVL